MVLAVGTVHASKNVPESNQVSDEYRESAGLHPPHPEPTQPSYEYRYSVASRKTGDVKGAWEKRRGDDVWGAYFLRDPDGFWRTVHYEADETGFHSTVRRVPLGRSRAKGGQQNGATSADSNDQEWLQTLAAVEESSNEGNHPALQRSAMQAVTEGNHSTWPDSGPNSAPNSGPDSGPDSGLGLVPAGHRKRSALTHPSLPLPVRPPAYPPRPASYSSYYSSWNRERPAPSAAQVQGEDAAPRRPRGPGAFPPPAPESHRHQHEEAAEGGGEEEGGEEAEDGERDDGGRYGPDGEHELLAEGAHRPERLKDGLSETEELLGPAWAEVAAQSALFEGGPDAGARPGRGRGFGEEAFAASRDAAAYARRERGSKVQQGSTANPRRPAVPTASRPVVRTASRTTSGPAPWTVSRPPSEALPSTFRFVSKVPDEDDVLSTAHRENTRIPKTLNRGPVLFANPDPDASTLAEHRRVPPEGFLRVEAPHFRVQNKQRGSLHRHPSAIVYSGWRPMADTPGSGFFAGTWTSHVFGKQSSGRS